MKKLSQREQEVLAAKNGTFQRAQHALKQAESDLREILYLIDGAHETDILGGKHAITAEGTIEEIEKDN